MEIGQKIKEARLAKGFTQQELGDLVGVQKSAIAKYESGRVINIKRGILQKITTALDMRPSELIFDDSPKDTANMHVRILTDFELMESLKDYYDLSEENKKVIRDLIRKLKKSEV